jgi:hypothetical protein
MLGPSDLKQIDQAIQAGRGAAASVLGQTYNVYRLSSAAQAGILTTTPVIVGYQAYLAKASKAKIENDTLELEVAQWTCDVTNLILGDVLVETGYKSEGSSWCFAQARPRRESLFVRVELAAKIYRPRIGNIIPAGTAAASPGAPFVSPTFASSDLSTRDPLTLVNGVYAFSQTPTDTPATVPVGIQLTARAGGTRGANSLPGSSATARFVGYVPPLGVALNQDDVIYIDDDHSYIVNLALTETVGLIGTVCILEEEGE